jgi:hypothetical protein
MVTLRRAEAVEAGEQSAHQSRAREGATACDAPEEVRVRGRGRVRVRVRVRGRGRVRVR